MRHDGRDVRHVVVPAHTSVRSIAIGVLGVLTDEERATPNGSVDMLLFNSHGGPGIIHIGEGITHHNVATLGELTGPLLKPIVEGGEGIEIHCCEVAAGSTECELLYPSTSQGHAMTRSILHSRSHARSEVSSPDEQNSIGVRFLYAMACSFDIRVRASLHRQVPDWYGFFEGSIVEALPDTDIDWHSHVRQVMHSPLLIDEDIDSLRWQTVGGFY